MSERDVIWQEHRLEEILTPMPIRSAKYNK